MSSGVDDRLLLPVAGLPGPVPVGAPVVSYWGCPEHGPQREGRWRWSHCRHEDHDAEHVECSDYDALDLSAPPVDAAGYPLRVDGLDVAVGMLARALRMRPESGWTWSVYYGGRGDEGVWTSLRTGHAPHGRRWGYRAVPGLIDVEPAPDLDGPLSPRLAIIACFRARVWEANHE